MSHELFLTTKQTNKIRNAFANNISTHIKLSKVQIFKIIYSDGSFDSWLANLEKKNKQMLPFFFLRDNLPGLVSNLTSNGINKIERKIRIYFIYFKLRYDLCY